MAPGKTGGLVAARQRFVKIPETTVVKSARDLWARESADLDPLAMVYGPLLAAHRLTIGRFRGHHWYASIVSDVERPEGWPNALSGWGDTPHKALNELAFRWFICLRGSWLPESWNLSLVPILTREAPMEVAS